MNDYGFHASTTGGKKLFAVVLIAALILAALPVASVFAAPPPPTTPTGDNSGSVSANQMRELQAAQTWFNNFRTQPGKGNSAKVQQYLDQYAFALGQAGAILRGGAANANGQANNSNGQNNNNNSNGQANNSNGQTGNNFTSQQNVGWWLHMMRGLREKIANASGDENNRNNAGSNGAGIPVTGGLNSTGSNSGSTGSSSTGSGNGSTGSSNSGSSSGSTSSSGSGTATNSQNSASNNNNDNSLSKMWGPQFRELQAAQTWFNNFRTKPGQDRNSAKTSQYLAQYAFALRQANAIIRNGTGNNATGQNSNNNNNQSNNANGQSNNNNNNGQANNQSFGFGTPQQQLAAWLHMMRGLQEKIAGGNTNTTSSSSTTP